MTNLVRRVTPTQIQQVTTIGLPPDILREIARDKTSAEIVTLCRVNKQFNNALCQDITFWRNRARSAGLPFAEQTTLAEFKRMLVEHEKKPQFTRTYDLIFKPGRALANYEKQLPAFGKIDREASHDARIFGEVSVENMKQILNEEYYKYYTLAENDIEDEYPSLEDLLTPEEFEAKLLQLNLHDFDIIDNSLPGYEDDISFYLVYTHYGVLSTILLERHFEDYNTIAFPSELSYFLKTQQQPITLTSLRQLYPEIPSRFYLGYISRDRHDYEFVDDGPDQVIDGVLMRVVITTIQKENRDDEEAYREAYPDDSDSDDD